MLFSIFDVFRTFETLLIFFYKFFLKWEKTEGDLESSIFFEAQKFYFVFESRIIFFSNGHIRNVVSTLPNVVKIDVENDNGVSALSDVVQFNVEIHNMVSTLLSVINFISKSYQPKNNAEPTLKCLLGLNLKIFVIHEIK